MTIVGRDFHPGWQQVAVFDSETGEIRELKLSNSNGEAERLWRPSKAERDLRQLLIHRHRLVGIRTRVKNGLHHLMLNKGIQPKQKLWSEAGQKILHELPLEG